MCIAFVTRALSVLTANCVESGWELNRRACFGNLGDWWVALHIGQVLGMIKRFRSHALARPLTPPICSHALSVDAV